MRRLTFRLSVALLTFIVGVTAASFWLLRWTREPHEEQAVSSPGSSPSQVDEVTRQTDSLKAILSDFSFIESGVYVPHSIPSHGMEPKLVPTRFEVGQQYIFHRRYLDNDALLKELQERIRSQGLEILAADKLAHRYVGGLLFRLKFRDAHYQFTIFNEPDLYILGNTGKFKDLSVDDYVLVVEEKGSQ